jgi:hypothetical protein
MMGQHKSTPNLPCVFSLLKNLSINKSNPAIKGLPPSEDPVFTGIGRPIPFLPIVPTHQNIIQLFGCHAFFVWGFGCHAFVVWHFLPLVWRPAVCGILGSGKQTRIESCIIRIPESMVESL